MKPRGKKLVFTKETVRTLTDSQLNKALGGMATIAETIICISETGGCTNLCDTIICISETGGCTNLCTISDGCG
jgi:hypothetical protein